MYDAKNRSTMGLGIHKKTNFDFLRVRLKKINGLTTFIYYNKMFEQIVIGMSELLKLKC